MEQIAVPHMTFREAATQVVASLRVAVPMACWAVSRRRGDRQVLVHVEDDVYGTTAGESLAWADSMCQYMVAGVAPRFAPDVAAVPAYAGAGIARQMPIGAYIGLPIRAADGQLFGTLCAIDPHVQQRALADHAPLLMVMTALLEQVLHRDRLLARTRAHDAEVALRALHDPLTSLANRTSFRNRLARALALRERAPRALSLLVVDLDDFTAVNDLLGHADADQLLVEVAARIRGVLHTGDAVARLDGDEFAVLPLQGTHPRATADRIQESLREPFRIDGLPITVRASIGITELAADDAAVSGDVLLAQAESALSVAKRHGKGRIARYEPVLALLDAGDLLLREPLRQALSSGALEVRYQPVVDLRSNQVVSFEALSRWTHQGVPVPPDVFIPLAARSGLLPALTEQVLERACAQAARWSAERAQPVTVAVNICPDALGDPGLPDRIAALLRRHRLGAAQLVLEITEDALLADVAAATAVSSRLRDLGVRLSLDDFGTGYSSLLHLRQIPLDSFKVDRGFTADIDSDPTTEEFMRALLVLGRQLGLSVVVEGVERTTQVEVLRRLGCEYAQGYLFAPALPPDDVPWQTSALPGWAVHAVRA